MNAYIKEKKENPTTAMYVPQIQEFADTNCIYVHEGVFWIRRFRDAWESCSHKKAVAFAIFTLVWNLSSIVARIWAGKIVPDFTSSPFDPKFGEKESLKETRNK